MNTKMYAENRLCLNDAVYLYGFNNISNKAYWRMREQGFSVKGIIDPIAYKNQKIVINVEELKKRTLNESVIIVCLNNGVSHDIIAERMYQLGFRRILYLPMRLYGNQSLEEQRNYRLNYRLFIEGRYPELNVPVYASQRVKALNSFIVIKEDKEETSFWCPQFMLRAGSKKQYSESSANRKLSAANILMKYCDCRIEEFVPYIALFKALGSGNENKAHEYLLIQRNNEAERKKLYEDRRCLFEVYEQRFRYDMTFFLDSPAKVAWDRRGWLAVRDGLHRIYYLNYKGYEFYPVVTSREEYELSIKYFDELQKKECFGMDNKETTKIENSENGGVIGRDNKRVELWRVVPRSVPFAIGLTPSDICNFRCNYCNQSTETGIKEAQILTWENFLIICHQIEELLEKGQDDLKIIRLIGNGEPLVNKKLPEMVAYLSEKKYAPRIEVTTNGSLLTHEYSDALIEAGLTRLLVSVQGTSREKYKEICGYSMDMDKFTEQIAYFYQHKKQCGVYVKTVDVALEGEEDRKKFFDTYREISDVVCVEQIMDVCADVDYANITDKDMEHVARYGGEFKEKICCDTLFMYFNIHSNGDVDCCGCKYPPLFIGNVYKTPIKELWNGKVHKEVMIKHLQGKRKNIPLCAKCCFEGFNTFPEDNLDEHLDDVCAKVLSL